MGNLTAIFDLTLSDLESSNTRLKKNIALMYSCELSPLYHDPTD